MTHFISLLLWELGDFPLLDDRLDDRQSFLHTPESGLGFMVSQQMPILVPHSLTPLSACAAGFYTEPSDYLPKTNRIQDRDGLGLCSLIKLVIFLFKNVKKIKEHTFKILKQYLTQTLS